MAFLAEFQPSGSLRFCSSNTLRLKRASSTRAIASPRAFAVRLRA
jgi:hypothetical protein